MDLEKFFAIEKQYGLLEENVDGFFFWIYARADIFYNIRDRIYNHDPAFPQRKKSVFEKLELRAKMFYHALFHGFVNIGPYDVIVLNSPRRVWENDHYECIYTDDIVKELKSAAVLEGLFEQKHFRPVRTPNLFYLDGVEMRAQMHYYLYKYLKKKEFENKKNQIYSKISEPLRQLALAYEVEINCAEIVDLIMPMLYKYHSKKKSYNRIVKKVMPKIVLEVNSEAMDCMVITELAKERGIPVVELQHGIMGKTHIVYNYPPDVVIKQFPDYLFLFSDFWKLGNRCPIPDKNIIPVGFPYLEKQRTKYPPNKERAKTVLLFLSQGMVSKHLAKIAIELLGSLNMDHYRIIFKLHPGEYATWREELNILQNVKEIEVIDNNKKNIYEFFAMADIQIGYISTAVYEGMSYNLDTYIYTQNHNTDMEDLIKLGYAKEFTTGDELLQLIRNRDKASGEMNHTEEFWTRNALNNIKDNLSMLKGEE